MHKSFDNIRWRDDQPPLVLTGKTVLPLAVGIHTAMQEFLAEPEDQGQRKALAAALRWFASTAAYLDACLNDVIRDRFDCHGGPDGTLSDTDRAAAAARLAYLAAKPRKVVAPVESPATAGNPATRVATTTGNPATRGAVGANGSRPLLTLPGRGGGAGGGRLPVAQGARG